jgi:hypothetical protein
MPVLMSRQDRKAGKRVVTDARIERRANPEPAQVHTICCPNTRDLNLLQAVELRQELDQRELAARNEWRRGLYPMANRRSRHPPQQPTNRISTVPARGRATALPPLLERRLYKWYEGLAREIEVGDTLGHGPPVWIRSLMPLRLWRPTNQLM